MTRVMVAMSGGVDSSVAAALLVEQGHEVVGVHMKLHDAAPGRAGACCGLDDALDARAVADRLGVPFYVLDLQEAFQAAVIDPWTADWLAGRTPNPCVLCNGVLKFRVLLARARGLGCDRLATGHYARIDASGALRMAADGAKDQSYFLYPVPPSALARTWFPLGELDKATVRAHARRLGLITADKAESMDTCFVPDGDHGAVVDAARPDLDLSGEIVDEAGAVLGRHDGYHRYTIGQRHGLRVALGFPAYVLRIEPETARVVVGGGERLLHHGLTARDAVWQGPITAGQPALARIRHRGGLTPCRLYPSPDGGVRAAFDVPARAVTPGQAAVFYEGDRVLGGATIVSAWAPSASVEPPGAAA